MDTANLQWREERERGLGRSTQRVYGNCQWVRTRGDSAKIRAGMWNKAARKAVPNLKLMSVAMDLSSLLPMWRC